MGELEQVCFEMIAANGSARSYFLEALMAAKEKNYGQADALMEEGEKMLSEGHHAHGGLLSREASGDKVQVDLLLVHAEDQMMAAETFRIMAKELIEIHKKLG